MLRKALIDIFEGSASVTATHIDAPVHYAERHWTKIRFNQEHHGVMLGINYWVVTRDNANTGNVDNSLNADRKFDEGRAASIVATMERTGMLLNNRANGDSAFIAYPKRNENEFEVDAGDVAAKWMSDVLGIKCRLTCVYLRLGEQPKVIPVPATPTAAPAERHHRAA